MHGVPNSCIYGVVVTLLPSKQSSRVRISLDAPNKIGDIMKLTDVYVNEKQELVAVFKTSETHSRFIVLPKEEAIKLANQIKEIL